MLRLLPCQVYIHMRGFSFEVLVSILPLAMTKFADCFRHISTIIFFFKYFSFSRG